MSALADEIAALEQQASAPDLWDDQEAAQKVTSRLSFLQQEQRRVLALRQRVDDLPILIELARDEGRCGLLAEAAREVEVPQTEISELEVRTLLSGSTTNARRWSPSGPVPVGWMRLTGPRCCCVCTAATASGNGWSTEVYEDLVRRRGRHQVRDVRREGAVRLRHALCRAGHAPARAHLAVRQPGATSDLLRRGRGDPRDREDREHRDPRRTSCVWMSTARRGRAARA